MRRRPELSAEGRVVGTYSCWHAIRSLSRYDDAEAFGTLPREIRFLVLEVLNASFDSSGVEWVRQRVRKSKHINKEPLSMGCEVGDI